MTEPTTQPTPTDEMVERVAEAIGLADINEEVGYDVLARAAIAALAPELNRADLTGRAVALKVRDAKQAGRDVTNEEINEALADPLRVVMKK